MLIEYVTAKLNIPYFLDQSGLAFAKFIVKERKPDHLKIQYLVTKNGSTGIDTITPGEWDLFGVYSSPKELTTYEAIEDWFFATLYPHKRKPVWTRAINTLKSEVLKPEKQYVQLLRRLND